MSLVPCFSALFPRYNTTKASEILGAQRLLPQSNGLAAVAALKISSIVAVLVTWVSVTTTMYEKAWNNKTISGQRVLDNQRFQGQVHHSHHHCCRNSLLRPRQWWSKNDWQKTRTQKRRPCSSNQCHLLLILKSENDSKDPPCQGHLWKLRGHFPHPADTRHLLPCHLQIQRRFGLHIWRHCCISLDHHSDKK